jgi:hypothetical protein
MMAAMTTVGSHFTMPGMSAHIMPHTAHMFMRIAFHLVSLRRTQTPSPLCILHSRFFASKMETKGKWIEPSAKRYNC